MRIILNKRYVHICFCRVNFTFPRTHRVTTRSAWTSIGLRTTGIDFFPFWILRIPDIIGYEIYTFRIQLEDTLTDVESSPSLVAEHDGRKIRRFTWRLHAAPTKYDSLSRPSIRSGNSSCSFPSVPSSDLTPLFLIFSSAAAHRAPLLPTPRGPFTARDGFEMNRDWRLHRQLQCRFPMRLSPFPPIERNCSSKLGKR